MEELYEVEYRKDNYTVRRQFWLSKPWTQETGETYNFLWWLLHEKENTPSV